jgi:Carbamoylphosphate synthase small subunit
MASPAILLLENEEPFYGAAMGSEGVAAGPMVVSTLAAGFSDLMTDPVYAGKIICFTYPHVGNTGIVPQDFQSDGSLCRAVAAREISRVKANRLGVDTMDDYLKENYLPAIEGVDTRTLAEIVSRRGMVRAVLGTGKCADVELLKKELASDLSFQPPAVGTRKAYEWKYAASTVKKKRIVVYDLGVKKGFLRRLSNIGCSVRVVPADCSAADALAEQPDGVVFSAGPGTPESRPETLNAVVDLLGKAPVWGVGIGAGLVADAAGANVVVDGRGQFGCHPVGRPGESSAEMTMQCHEFWIEGESLANANLQPTHFNLNDGTLEGFACPERKIMGVLFHPESEPGQRDSLYLFDRFYEMMLK